MSTNNKFLDATGLKYVYDKINNKITSVESEVNNIKGVTDVVEIYDEVIGSLQNTTSSINSRVTTLEGDVTTDGSIKYSINLVKNELMEEIDTKVDFQAVQQFEKQLNDNTTAIEKYEETFSTITGPVEQEGSILYEVQKAVNSIELPEPFDPTPLQDSIEANADAIELLNKDADTEGSVKYIVSNSVDSAKAELNERIDSIQNSSLDGIKANADAIKLLNGASTDSGSVKNTVATELAKIVNDAPETLDTLGEIAAWIASDETNSAEFITKIAENEAAIALLNKDAETEGSIKHSIKTAINEIEAFDPTSLQKDIKDNADAIELLNKDAETEGSIKHSIKTAIDEIEAFDPTALQKDIKDNTDAIELLNKDAETEGSIKHSIKTAIDAIEPFDPTELQKDIKDNTGAIELLNKDAETEGSIKHSIKTAIDKIEMPEPFDPTALEQAISANSGKITTNINDINILKDGANVEGSVAYSIKQAIDPLQTKIDGKVDYSELNDLRANVNALSGKVTSNTTLINTLNADKDTAGSVDYKIENATADLMAAISGKADKGTVTDLSLDVERIDAVAAANKSSITTLNADKTTEGSVDYKVNVLRGDLMDIINPIDSLVASSSTLITNIQASINTLNADKTTEGSVDYKIEAAKKILRDEISEIAGSGGIDPAVLDGLRKGISDNLTAINLLNSDSNTEGSVDYKISAAIDNFKCPSTAITTEELDEIMATE